MERRQVTFGFPRILVCFAQVTLQSKLVILLSREDVLNLSVCPSVCPTHWYMHNYYQQCLKVADMHTNFFVDNVLIQNTKTTQFVDNVGR